MRVDPIQLYNQSKLIDDYRNEKTNIMQYFDYSPFHNYEQRVKDLKNRNFNRKKLTETLKRINEEWDAPNSTHNNIERLKDDSSVVVIGGQQAGLLTGPMYTINKVISIIQFAKQQEAKLSVPVIPVFWIAGEDHDYDEINHIYLMEQLEMKKYRLMQQVSDKKSVSTIGIDEDAMTVWMDTLFEQLRETEHTKGLYTKVKTCLEKSSSYVDFFARLLFTLFNDEGLVLIDSGHPSVRQLESDFFIELINKQEELANEVYASFQKLQQNGYTIPLEIEKRDAHLFYHLNGERVLLERTENGEWIGKNDEVLLTTKGLIKIATDSPALLSNNVITRPLMQEFLFPTLSFIGGNGEISYWAVLKNAFNLFEMTMPPILPRLSITYIDQKIVKLLNEYSISITHAINQGVDDLKLNWLAAQSNPPIEYVTEQLKRSINNAHKPLRDIASDVRSDLGDLATKNLDYVYGQIDYLEKRILKVIEAEYTRELSSFDYINNTLHPFNGLQERIWNPLPFINHFGVGFLKELVNGSCSFEEQHYVVHI